MIIAVILLGAVVGFQIADILCPDLVKELSESIF